MNQNNVNALSESEREFELRNKKKYEVKSIVNNAVMTKRQRFNC